jgi:hypothetical protein
MHFNPRVFWRIVFLAAAIYFVARGPWRAVHDSGDFLIQYTGARAWLHGVNPYLPAGLPAVAKDAGATVPQDYFLNNPSVYPPFAFPLLAPFAILPWGIAKFVWLALILGFTIWSISKFAGFDKRWTLPIATFLLAFAPVHTGLAKGQPAVVVCGLLFASLFTPHVYISGVLLGLATCIKPQLTIGFLLLAAAQRQYRKLAVVAAIGVVGCAIGLGFIAAGWYPAWASVMGDVVGSSSGVGSVQPRSPIWYQLINLHVLIPQSLAYTPVEVILYGIAVTVTAAAVFRARNDKMAWALIAPATILISYHRFYDAELLWLGIPAILLLAGTPVSRLLWVCYAVFLVPGQTIVALVAGAETSNPWWGLLLRHETMAVIVIWAIFVWIALRPGSMARRVSIDRAQVEAAV